MFGDLNDRPSVITVVFCLFVCLAALAAFVVFGVGDIKCWKRAKGHTYDWTFGAGCRIETSPAKYIPIEEFERFSSQQQNKEQ